MNLRVKFISSIGLLGLVCLMLPGSLRADDFTFSFANTEGNTAGTVTGEILGLSNNTTGAASEVIITSFPAGLISTIGPAPILVTAWNDQVVDSFTETAGLITNASFVANIQNGGVDRQGFSLNDPSGISGLTLDGGNVTGVVNQFGFSGITFTPVPAPEPSSLLLLGAGFLGLLGMGSRKKRLA